MIIIENPDLISSAPAYRMKDEKQQKQKQKEDKNKRRTLPSIGSHFKVRSETVISMRHYCQTVSVPAWSQEIMFPGDPVPHNGELCTNFF